MINEKNYHIYIDDFVNGFLEEELEMEFVAFLEKHPGIMDDEMLQPQEYHLDDDFKNSLKKEVELGNASSDELLIAELEGDLNPEQKRALDKMMIQHPMLERDRKLVGLTKLDAAEVIAYPNKSSLKKRPALYLYTRWSVGVAAALLAGLAIFQFTKTNTPDTEHIADNPVIEVPVELKNPEKAATEEFNSTQDKQVAFVSDEAGTSNPSLASVQKGHPKVQENRVQPKPVESVANLTRQIEFQMEDQPELNALASIYTPNTIKSFEEPQEQTIVQWAYKKLRGKVGAGERIIPENEIPKDAANLVMAKVAPVFQYNPAANTIKIGGLEINRRSTR